MFYLPEQSGVLSVLTNSGLSKIYNEKIGYFFELFIFQVLFYLNNWNQIVWEHPFLGNSGGKSLARSTRSKIIKVY